MSTSARRRADAGPHARYRTRLELAARTPELVDLLTRSGLLAAGTWRRHFARFLPGEPTWAVVVLASHVAPPVRVDLLEVRPDEGSETVTPFPAGGWLRVTAFPADPRLGGLTAAAASLDGCEVVRYRPARRCTLRGTTAGRGRFVKVSRHAEAIHRIGTELWRAAAAGGLGFDVAEPLGYDPETMSVAQGVVAGRPVVPLVLGPDGGTHTARLGRALGALARSGLEPSSVVGPDEQLRRTTRGVVGAASRVPALAARLEGVLGALTDRHSRLARRPLVPVHGSPHVNQWLLDGDRLGLVDFDRYAAGEPELDIATYLAELDTERSLSEPVGRHEEAICAGFAEVAGPLDADRLRLYRVHKRVSKVVRTTHALRPDGDERAARHLGAVEELLFGADRSRSHHPWGVGA